MIRLKMEKWSYFENFIKIDDWIKENCRGKVDAGPLDIETDSITYSFKYKIDALAFSLRYL